MIELKGINKKYNNQIVLSNLNLSFSDTGFYLITGRSGIGKSTLLNIIAGYEVCDTGSILFDGKQYLHMNKLEQSYLRKNYIATVFQDSFLINDLTVYNNLMLVLDLIDNNNYNKIDDILSELGILSTKDKYPNQLSGGERQRVSIARCIIRNPSVILCDEPTGNLDLENSKNIYAILKQIAKSRLVIMVSHDRELALDYVDYNIELSNLSIQNLVSNDRKFLYKKTKGFNLKNSFMLSLLMFKRSRKKLYFSIFVLFLFFTLFMLFASIFSSNPHRFEYDLYKESNLIYVYSDYDMYTKNSLVSTNISGIDYSLINKFRDSYNKNVDLLVQTSDSYKGTTDSIYEYFIIEEDSKLNINEVAITSVVAQNMVNKGYYSDYDHIIGTSFSIGNNIVTISEIRTLCQNDLLDEDIYLSIFMSQDTFNILDDPRIFINQNGLAGIINTDFESSGDIYIPIKYSSNANLLEGKLPSNNKEVAIPLTFIGDKEVGDIVTINKTEYTIVGIVKRDDDTDNAYYLDKDTFYKLVDEYGSCYSRECMYGVFFELGTKKETIDFLSLLYSNAFLVRTIYDADIASILSTLYLIKHIMLLVLAIITIISLIIYNYVFKNIFNTSKDTMSIIIALGGDTSDLSKLFLLQNIIIQGVVYLFSTVGLIILIPLINIWYSKAFMFNIKPISMNGLIFVLSIIITLLLSFIINLSQYLKLRKKKIVDLLYNR